MLSVSSASKAKSSPCWEHKRFSGDTRVHALRRSDPKSNATSKIASFDLDGTLVSRPSAQFQPRSAADYAVLPNRKHKLQTLHSLGWRIVIFSNQGMIGPNADKSTTLTPRVQKLIDNVAYELEVPLDVYVAVISSKHNQDQPASTSSHDCRSCRKPSPGMWDLLARDMSQLSDPVSPCIDHSFFVGDAAGRSGDHSSDDANFASTLGLRFYTPEDFFESADIPPAHEPLAAAAAGGSNTNERANALDDRHNVADTGRKEHEHNIDDAATGETTEVSKAQRTEEP